MATHRYNIENATAQLIVASFNECEIKQHHSRHERFADNSGRQAYRRGDARYDK